MAGQGLGKGGSKSFGSGGVGGRGTGPRDGANCVVFLTRFFEGDRGGRPRALVAGEGWGGRWGLDGSFIGPRAKVGSPKPLGPRLGLGGRSKGFGAGGVGGGGGVQGLRFRGGRLGA